jgi:hypothetical protein
VKYTDLRTIMKLALAIIEYALIKENTGQHVAYEENLTY